MIEIDTPFPDSEYAPTLRIARSDDDPDWTSQIVMSTDRTTGSQYPTTCIANAVLFLEQHPRWRGVLAYDVFSDAIACRKPPPFDRGGETEWGDNDDARATVWLERNGLKRVPTSLARAAVNEVASRHRFNPVQDYLGSLKWDGIERLPHWLSDVFDCDQTDYAAEVGMRWIMSAAKRALEPGCQADYAIVLEGPQGARKSSAVAALVPNRKWFTDELPPMGSKDAAMQLQGTWILELAELDSFSRAEMSTIKAFVTRRVDKYRPPYAARTVNRPRHCVLVGTVNPDGSGYLKDDTGDRRWWPVTVKRERANVDWICLNRDQLWAEAMHRLKSGEPWHIANTVVEQAATEEQRARQTDDPWFATLAEWAIGKTGDHTSAEIMSNALKLEKGKHDRAAETRVGKLMRKIGWGKERKSITGVRVYVYFPQKKESSQLFESGAPDRG